MGLSEQIRAYLKEISLGQLLERDFVSDVAKRQGRQVEHVIELQTRQEKRSA